MRRLLFAIGLIVLAVVALSTFGAADQPEPIPLPTSFAFDFPTRIPASTRTPGPPQPTNVAVAELRTAYEQTSALASLKADITVSTNLPAGAEATDIGVTNHSVLTITADGMRQYTESSDDSGASSGTNQTMDVIVIGATGYVSNTTMSEAYASTPISSTAEPDSGWLIMPREQSAAMDSATVWPQVLAQFIDPAHDLPLLVLQGQENVSGIACDRYVTDQAALGPAGVMPGMEGAQKKLLVWLCADGNIRRIETSMALAYPQNPDVSITMRMELIEAPTTAVIAAPANAQPMKR
jgi:hypothetical protein